MDTMFILGEYIFGLASAAPNQFARDTTYNWPAQDVFAASQALQFTGWGEETITLEGVIYTEFIGNTNQLHDMRTMGDMATPLTLIDGRGNVLGDWVIKRINERQDAFARAGAPLRQHFSMSLARYGGSETISMASGAGALSQLQGATGGGGLFDLLSMATSGIQVGGIAGSAFGTASGALAGITGAQGALTAIQRGMDAAGELQAAARTVQTTITNIKQIDSLGGALGAINSLVATAGTTSSTAARSGQALIGLVDMMPANVRGVVQAAGYAGNQLATSAAKISAGVQKTLGGLGL